MPQELKSVKPNPIALLVVGGAGCGKSTLASLFPRPYFLDIDKNLAGPKKVWREEYKKDCPVLFDHIDVDDNGKEIPMPQQYLRFAKLLKEAASGDWCDTIVIDTTTSLSDVIMADVLRQSPTKTGKMEIPSWGEYLFMWKKLISLLRACPKNVIFNGHYEIQKNDLDQVLRYAFALPGKIGELLPGMFTDVWRLYVDMKLVGGKQTPVRMISTLQSERYPNLKSSLSMPNSIEVTPDNINNILATNV